ncbi:hypothetical protein PCYB_005040, partial [Plasmodium cynomolgi strain B]
MNSLINICSMKKICSQENDYNQYNNKCKFFVSADEKEKNKITIICLRFYCLMNNIFKLDSSPNTPIDHVHLEYLNYWLNYELHNNYADTYPKQLYRLMKANDSNNSILSKLNSKIKDIDVAEMKNMNWLFYLYREYFNIIKAITNDYAKEETFHGYPNPIPEEYKEFEEKCLKETSCRKVLCAFKEKYESIKLEIPELEDLVSKMLPSLKKSANAQVNASLLENNEQNVGEDIFDIPTNIIIGSSIATLGVSLIFFLFYKVNNK